jgi:prepilin-type N-terminal cleavage/methylation domain-containing protein
MRLKHKRGFTLLELMVVVALFATCSLVVAKIFKGTVDAVTFQKERSTSEEDARMALDVISSDLREAYSVDDPSSLNSPGTSSISFTKRTPLFSLGQSFVKYSIDNTRILREEKWGASYIQFYVGSNIQDPDNINFQWADASGNSRIRVSLREGSTTSRGRETAFVTEANMRSQNPMAVEEKRPLPPSEAVTPGF